MNILAVNPAKHPIQLQGFGTVQAKEQIAIIAQVSGTVLTQAPNLETGHTFTQGALLFKIDPEPYQLALELEKAKVARSAFELAEEQGRQKVAEREWGLLNKASRPKGVAKELALRRAHVAEKQSALKASQSSQQLAELDLKHTQILAPCSGKILSESIAVGQFISAGTTVINFACMDQLQVKVLLPQQQVHWLQPTGASLSQASARLNQRPAHIINLLPELDTTTKMAQLLLEVETAQNTSLLLGQLVTAHITIQNTEAVYRLPIKALRENNQIWVRNQAKRLEILSVDVISYDKQFALIKPIVATSETSLEIITSMISSPYVGMPVKTEHHSQ